jgi:hypothetical protein
VNSPAQQNQLRVLSVIVLLLVFVGIIYLAWYTLGRKLEAADYVPLRARATCHIGKLVRLEKVLHSEHSTTVNHFQVIYNDNGQSTSNCSFFSQLPFEKLEELARDRKRVCILYDANKNNAVGIFRPRYLSR